MADPSSSSSALSQASEFYHRVSLPSLDSSLSLPRETQDSPTPLRHSSYTGPSSSPSVAVIDYDAERQKRRRKAAARMTIPPPRKSSKRKSQFEGFEGVFGVPSVERHENIGGLLTPPSTYKVKERPRSMVEEVREIAAQVRQSRFEEGGLTRGEFSTPRSFIGDMADPRSGAAPSPSISAVSQRRSRIGQPITHPIGIPRLPEHTHPRKLSPIATQLYTISYLIIFAIFGTLARLGLQSLTFYPGAPVVLGVLWANFTGSLILGFLLEDWKLFHEGWARPSSPDSQLGDVEQELLNAKKTVPLYVGLSTGFCGSFTSFSSFMRDGFLSISNNLPTPSNHPYPKGFAAPSSSTTIHRNAGYSVLSLLAVILLNISLSMSGFKLGCHIATFLNPIIPTISFSFTRKFVDPAIVPIAWLAWIGALILAIFPPDRPGGPSAKASWAAESWRGDAILAILFAPLGCLLRYFVSVKLNSVSPNFPLGTFAVNVFGTAVLGMSYDLQHVPLGQGYNSGIGGGLVGCQVLQGIEDGFCGCLTTVSTWVAEMDVLTKGRAYVYGIASVAGGLGILVIVMGSVRWGLGWEQAIC